jgi:hypothetical protein
MVARLAPEMRIWFQRFGVQSELRGYVEALRRHLERVTGPDLSVHLAGIEESVLAAKYVRFVQLADTVQLVRSVL